MVSKYDTRVQATHERHGYRAGVQRTLGAPGVLRPACSYRGRSGPPRRGLSAMRRPLSSAGTTAEAGQMLSDGCSPNHSMV